jgi:hypothetical protein
MITGKIASERMYEVGWNGQRTVVKATWKGEAVMRALKVEPHEMGYPYEVAQGGTCYQTVKGKAFVKLHTRKVPYGITCRAFINYRQVFTKFMETKARTQVGLMRTTSLCENKLRHDLNLMGIDWDRIEMEIHYREE